MYILTYALSPPDDAWFNVNTMQSCLCRAHSGFALWNSAVKKFISICCWLNLPMEPIDSEVNCIHFPRLFRKTKPLGTPVVAKVPWPFLFFVRRLQHLSLPGHPLSELPACLLISDSALGTDPSQPSSHSCLLTSTFYPRLPTPEMLHLAL